MQLSGSLKNTVKANYMQEKLASYTLLLFHGEVLDHLTSDTTRGEVLAATDRLVRQRTPDNARYDTPSYVGYLSSPLAASPARSSISFSLHSSSGHALGLKGCRASAFMHHTWSRDIATRGKYSVSGRWLQQTVDRKIQ